MIKDNIITCLTNAVDPLDARTIAEEIGENYDTVRARLSELVEKRIIYRFDRGRYTINPRHLLGGRGSVFDFGLVRVQNLRMIVENFDIETNDIEEVSWDEITDDGYGKMKLSLETGVKNNKITCSFSTPMGIDYQSFLLLRRLIDNICASKGFPNPSWVVSSVELFNDYHRLKLDGLTGVTINCLDSILVKLYQKRYGVRYEVKTNRPMQIDELFSLLSGGAPAYCISRDIIDIGRQQEEVQKLLKYQYGILNKVRDILAGLLKDPELLTQYFVGEKPRGFDVSPYDVFEE